MVSPVDKRCVACLEDLKLAFEAIERGDLAHRIADPAGSSDRDVALAFNRMAERFEAATRETRQALAEARRALERERLITEAVGLGSWTYDLRTGRVRVQSAVERRGDERESFEQAIEAFDGRIHPDDVARVHACLDEYLERGLPRFEAEFRIRLSDGTWRWMGAFGRVVERDARGMPSVVAGAHRDVTDTYRAREEVEAQQRFIAALSGNVPGVLHRLRVDDDGRMAFTFVGRNAREILGIEAEHCTLERLFELVTPETRAGTAAKLHAELASGSHAEVEYDVVLPDGRAGALRCVANLVSRDDRGADWDGIIIDITAEVEQRRELQRARLAAEAATAKEQQALADVRRALERERLVHDAVGLGTWCWDLRDGRVVVDERFARMLGETTERLEGDVAALAARVHPDDRDRMWASVAAYLDGGTSRYEAVFRMRHRDGSWRWIASFAAALERDGQGRPRVLGGAHRDVTDVHRARAALDAQQRMIASLSGNVPAVLHRMRVGHDGRMAFEFVGRNVRELLGVDAEQFTMAQLVALMTPETRDTAMRQRDADVASGTHSTIEFDVVLPDGRMRALRCVSNLVGRDESGTEWDGMLIDVTREVERRRELEQARRAAEAANEAKSAFLASMSHELRTPLTGILGYAQLIERRSREPAVVPLAATIRTSAERMRELLNDILDTTKIEAGAMAVEVAPMALGAVVDEVTELFRPAIDGKGLALVVDAGPAGQVPVSGDARRVRQVLVNLLSNAVKFTERGRITVSLRADDDAVRMRVADTGPGVPRDFRGAIFERFRQADGDVSRQHGGTGLGLALSRDFARLMGGSLRLCDGDGTGSGAVFELRLTRLPPAPATP